MGTDLKEMKIDSYLKEQFDIQNVDIRFQRIN